MVSFGKLVSVVALAAVVGAVTCFDTIHQIVAEHATCEHGDTIHVSGQSPGYKSLKENFAGRSANYPHRLSSTMGHCLRLGSSEGTYGKSLDAQISSGVADDEHHHCHFTIAETSTAKSSPKAELCSSMSNVAVSESNGRNEDGVSILLAPKNSPPGQWGPVQLFA